MASNPISGLIPRGSLGLKLLLVCLLVLVMGIPLLVVGGLVGERESQARSVTAQIGADAGGSQVVGGPMLIVPYTRTIEVTDDQGRTQRRADRGAYVIFAETGSADTTLAVQDRRLGIYRAAIYTATTSFDAAFKPAEAMGGVDDSIALIGLRRASSCLSAIAAPSATLPHCASPMAPPPRLSRSPT